MDALLAKLNSYHILSSLFPGAIFYNILNIFLNITFIELSFITEICIEMFIMTPLVMVKILIIHSKVRICFNVPKV